MTITNVSEPPLVWENEIIIPNAQNLLVAGTNVLAIQVYEYDAEQLRISSLMQAKEAGAFNGTPGPSENLPCSLRMLLLRSGRCRVPAGAADCECASHHHRQGYDPDGVASVLPPTSP